MTEPIELDGPIVAVTVYPGQARIVRRGRVAVPNGVHTVALAGLPAALADDSVRVGGRGASARVIGVDVAWRHHATAPDPTVAALEDRLDGLRLRERELLDDDAARATQAGFLEELARRGGRQLARAMAEGEADGERVASFGRTVREELQSVAAERRRLAQDGERVAKEILAVEAELEDRRRQRATERREIDVAIEAGADTTVELEVSYVVGSAGWRPAYDVRLDGDRVTLDWHGLVTQFTGEDWPECELVLSTARPAAQTTIPELDPWYVDLWRARPMPPAPAMAAGAAPAPGEAAPLLARAAKLEVADTALAPQPEAAAEQGATATSYRLPRPVAVPSDGSPHKAAITSIELPAALDYVAVPKLAEEAYLRATVTNGSSHTLLPGSMSVFHGDEFVGTTWIESVPPGDEVELHLGVDDRLKVERELTRRDTAKAMLSGSRRTSVTYTITLESRLPGPAKVAVVDQFPVSKHEDVKVRDTDAKPAPKERTELDVVTWELELGPGAKQELTLSFTLEHPRNERLIGWTD